MFVHNKPKSEYLGLIHSEEMQQLPNADVSFIHFPVDDVTVSMTQVPIVGVPVCHNTNHYT